jgi:hypothetical protein
MYGFKRIMILISSSAIIILLIILISPWAVNLNQNTQQIGSALEQSSEPEVSTVDVQPSYQYTLKQYGNLIGIFKGDEKKPMRIIEIDVSSLPYNDQDLLKEGIGVNSEQELLKLIEDYDS